MYLRFLGKKPRMSGKERFEVGGEALDDLRAPVLAVLPGKNFATDLPIKKDELPVDSQGCPGAGLSRSAALARLGILRILQVPPSGFHAWAALPLRPVFIYIFPTRSV
jgi:hypothetical protein